MSADFWPIDPLPMPELTEGTAQYWRRQSRLTLQARDDNRNELDAHYPDPTVADDEWADCPEDDGYTYTDADLQASLEDACDRGEPGMKR